MSKRKKAEASIVNRLNRRLTFRLLGVFLLLDAVLAGLALWRGAFWRNLWVAPVILGVELVALIFTKLSNRRLIRKNLAPLSQLSAAAAQLSEEPDRALSDLAGQLGRIDAGRLDTRLSVESAQAELKELTQAINALLARLDAAYAAQIRFVSDASHELRTPIAVIQGYTNLLNRWGKDDPAARQEAIDAIAAEAESMKTLIEQLLFLARGDNHTAKIQMEEVDVTELAAQVLKETAMIDRTHPLSADWTEGVRLQADPALVKEALRVLVDNAVKYTPENGGIVLKIRRENGEARLTVQDVGQGIPKECLPHVFDRFYRTDASRTRQTGGSGLGLSIALWIAQCHQGHLEVKSCPDLGSAFTLVLPCPV